MFDISITTVVIYIIVGSLVGYYLNRRDWEWTVNYVIVLGGLIHSTPKNKYRKYRNVMTVIYLKQIRKHKRRCNNE